jgi:hypothetical protein
MRSWPTKHNQIIGRPLISSVVIIFCFQLHATDNTITTFFNTVFINIFYFQIIISKHLGNNVLEKNDTDYISQTWGIKKGSAFITRISTRVLSAK